MLTNENIRDAEIRICVNFNKPKSKVLIYQEIVAQELEDIFAPVWV